MTLHPLSRHRNFGVLAHVDAGKTTVTERILYYTGRIRSMGEVHSGNTHISVEPEERKHGITISAVAVSTSWADCALTLIDTPGHVDFAAEVERSVRVLDGAIVVLDSTQGVEPQTESVWRRANRYRIPRVVFANKLDVVGASLEKCLGDLRARLGAVPLALQLPIGTESDFAGVVDLLTLKAVRFEAGQPVVGEVPNTLAAAAQRARDSLVETLTSVDDELLAAVVHGAVSAEQLAQAVRRATLSSKAVPVLCGAALRNIGVQPLLDAVVRYLPSPLDVEPPPGGGPDAPACALVFKSMADEHMGTLSWVRVYGGVVRPSTGLVVARTGQKERVSRLLSLEPGGYVQVEQLSFGQLGAIVGPRHARTGDTLCAPEAVRSLEAMTFPVPVVEMAIEPQRTDQLEKLALALGRVQVEDPTLQVRTDAETGQTLLCGVGELHLQIWVERLSNRFGVPVRTGAPKVALRETPKRTAQVRYRHVRQSGGPGQFAVVELAVRPLGRGEGFRFVDATRGGAIPRELVPAVEKGVEGALERGLTGTPVVDVEVKLLDGEVHVKDSSPLAFELAGSLGVQQALREAGMTVLEPVMRLDITVPEAFIGAVLGEVAQRRGSVGGLDVVEGLAAVTAKVPLQQVFGFVDALRSRSEGRGDVSMQLDGYEPVSG